MDPDLGAERTAYTLAHLAETPPLPHDLFQQWLREAFARRDSHGDLPEPSAVVLSTVASDPLGSPYPRSRTVLLKASDERGLVFYTNLESAKGRELTGNPHAALLCAWHPLQRQVRIEGTVHQVDDAQADAYFASRPRGSQLGAWASRQSEPIPSREDLDAAFTRAEQRFEGAAVPRPPFWGGFVLQPRMWEFWQGREDRLHDRFRFELRADGSWDTTRLQP